MPFDPNKFEQLKQQNIETGKVVGTTAQEPEPNRDLMGTIKAKLGLNPQPGERSMFGETELPGEIIRSLVPGSNAEAVISAALAGAGPILRGVGAGAKLANQGLAKVAPGAAKALSGAASTIAGIPRQIIKGGVESFGELLRPGVIREAGVEVAAGKMGQPMESLARALGPKASEKAYEAASKVAGTVQPKQFIDDAIKEVSSMANPSRQVLKYLNNMKTKLGNGTTYTHMIEELKQLRSSAESALHKANPDYVAGKAFYEVRAKALDAMDTISPTIKQANELFKTEESAKSVLSVLRKSGSGTKMRELFEHDPVVAKTFRGAGEEIYQIADKLGSIAGEAPMGVGNRIMGAMNNVSELIISDDAARAMFRRVLGGTPAKELPGAIFGLGRTLKNMTKSQVGRQVPRVVAAPGTEE